MRRARTHPSRSWIGPTIAAAVVFFAGCSSVPSDPIVGEPTIVGQITMVESSAARLRVLVEENPEVQQGSKIWFTIVEQTNVFNGRGVTTKRVSARWLEVGLKVEGLASGPIAESYPAQATAETIVILD